MSPQAGIGALLAFEDAESLIYALTHREFETRHLALLSTWENHRKNGMRNVLDSWKWTGEKAREHHDKAGD